MTAGWVLGWWNLIYVVPFGLALLYLGLYTLTGLSLDGADADADADAGGDVADAHGDVDADADAEVDADAHVDMDADANADADADAHLDADADADADSDAGAHHVHFEAHHADGPTAHAAHDHGHGATGAAHQQDTPLYQALLTFVGVGRAPLGLVLMVLLMTWGFIGFATNNAVRPAVPRDWMVALVSLPLAAVGSMLATGGVARLIARFMPTSETSAHKRRELCGNVGEAMFEITDTFGMCVVRDRHGNRFQLACRVGEGQPAVAKGAQVLLVRYDESDNVFTVRPYELKSNGATTASRPRIETTTAEPADEAPPTPAAQGPDTRGRVSS